MVKGKKVCSNYNQIRVDRYDRTLAYVFLENGAYLNAEIFKQGSDTLKLIPPCVV